MRRDRNAVEALFHLLEPSQTTRFSGNGDEEAHEWVLIVQTNRVIYENDEMSQRDGKTKR